MHTLSRQALRSAAASQQAQCESLVCGLGGAEAPSATSGDGVDTVPPFPQQGSRRRPSRCAGSTQQMQAGLQPVVLLRILEKQGCVPSLGWVLCLSADSRAAGRA